MASIGRLLICFMILVMAFAVCIPAAQAVDLGGQDYNDGSGNTDGLTYTQGSITIGEAGANKAWSFAPINWIDTTDATEGSVFVRSLVRRDKADAQWGGVSLFQTVDGDEIMYFGAATSGGTEPRAFFGFHDQESGVETASPVVFDVGTTHMMVGELDLVAGQARLWIDPAFGATVPTPDLTAPFALSAAGKEIGAVRLNAGLDGFIIGDEIAVGTMWNDVVPVPEPSAIVLLVMGALALVGLRRK